MYHAQKGAQWLSSRVLDARPRGRGFEPHRRHFVMSLSKKINHSLVLVQPRKTRPFITERLLMGRKNHIYQTNKQNHTQLVVTHKKNTLTLLVVMTQGGQDCYDMASIYVFYSE